MPQAEATVARVAAHFGIPVDVLLGRSRRAYIANARQIAMFLLYRQGMTLLGVGEELDRNTHTVWHGVHRIERELRSGNAETRHDLEALSKEA